MAAQAFDPEILQDFLTESGELLEQLEGDLVALEGRADDLPFINQVFRALHTIKGSASFLALTNLVTVAHAAEGALNAARNGAVRIDRAMMDLLLQAVDLVKVHMTQLREGAELAPPDAKMIAGLTALAEGKGGATSAHSAAHGAPHTTSAAASGATSSAAPSPAARPGSGTAPASGSTGPSERPLTLSPGKNDLLEFFVADLEESVGRVDTQLRALADEATRAEAAASLTELGDALCRSVDFFECEPMLRVARAVRLAGERGSAAAAPALQGALPRLHALLAMVGKQVDGLKAGKLIEWPAGGTLERVEHALTTDEALTPPPDGAPFTDVLALDAGGPAAHTPSAQAGAAPAAGAPESAAAGSATTPAGGASAEHAEDARSASGAGAGAAGGAANAGDEGKAQQSQGGAKGAEQTIRVEVGRLETLMNLVGELVLQKNRVAALARRCQAELKSQDLREAVSLAAGSLDRTASDIQLAVMRTRMQPLDKLFGKYPRLIRDLARKTNKQIELVIEGGETEVDKSVIEELGDPLVHLLRNSADHGVEPPDERERAGKDRTGIIRLSASHEGSHVKIVIADDGRGLNRERIAAKAVERGLVKPEQVAALPDAEVYGFIFLPGFSTADQVSDLSGRGVGMDVVRTNIERIKGTISLGSVPGKGATITITIPLTVAIMQAMMVAIEKEIYAVPLGSILEIIRPREEEITSIGERPVIRLRDSIVPLMSGVDLFEVRSAERPPTPFAVVLALDDRRVGLLVSRLIGQQEIVVKPLDARAGASGARGPVSGATVRDDGGVSLIVDVAELIRLGALRRAR